MLCDKCKTEMKKFPVLSETHFETLTACPKCQQSVIQKIRQANRRVAVKCLKTQNVPERYWSAKLTKENTAFAGVDDVKSGVCGLYLIGDSGVGKSWLSVAWMLYMLHNGYKCKYINWSDFMVQLRMDIKAYDSIRANALKHDVVVIDDFDATNQYMYDIVYNFINAMYNGTKLLIINSVELPTQSKLAMRIGEMTKQVMVVRK